MKKLILITLFVIAPILANANCAQDVYLIANANPNLEVVSNYQYNPWTGLFVTVYIVDTSRPEGDQIICLKNALNNPESVWCQVLECLQSYQN